MRVAICDDDHHQINIYESYIDKLINLGFSIDYDVFSSGEELLKQYEYSHDPYDLLFLDMQMDQMDGIETAQQLRKVDDKLIIIFVTSFKDYVYDSFAVNPFRYLVKPLQYEKFWEVFQAAYKEIKKKNKPYYVNEYGSRIRLYCEDIIYFESDRRKVRVYTKDTSHEFYGKLTDVYEELKENDFIHVHKSYLVNMIYIKGFHQYQLELNDGLIIPISENRKKDARAEYARFSTRKYHISRGSHHE